MRYARTRFYKINQYNGRMELIRMQNPEHRVNVQK